MAEITEDVKKGPPDFLAALAEFDAATLYEAAGRQGMVDPTIRPAWAGARLCGPAFTVECPPADNLMLHKAVAIARPGDIIVATVSGHLLAGAWGEILTVAAQARGIAGLVIDGAVRDIEAISRLGFPVFSRGLAIGSCSKREPGTLEKAIELGGVRVHPGDIVAADADGVVVLAEREAEDVCRRALERREAERVLIENLRRGKTTLELLGLEGAAPPPGGAE